MMPTTATFQRRKQRRYAVEVQAQIIGTSPEGGTVESQCRVLNLSRYGISFEAIEGILAEGSVAKIRFVFPKLPPTTTTIKLTRQRPLRTGIIQYSAELSFPQESERRKIHSFLSNLKEESIQERRETIRRQRAEGAQPDRRGPDRRRNFGIFTECALFASRVPGWKAAYTYFRRTETVHPGRIAIDGREMIWYGSKDYLGLSHHPRVKEAAARALERYGTKSGYLSVNGVLGIHEELEQELAEFRGAQAAVIFPGGYHTNVSILTALLKKDDVAFIDEKAHASILDGCVFSGAKIRLFRHNSASDLDRKIRRDKCSRSLIIVDGVYSVDGDIARLPEIKEVATAQSVPLMVDDAHGFGVLGPRGAGTPSHFGLQGKIDLDMGTFSGALGGIGGFVACDKYIKEYLQHLSRGYLFTVTLPAATTAGLLEALRILRSDEVLRVRLWSNIEQTRVGLKRLGWRVLPTESAIVTILIGDEQITYDVIRMLEELGVCVSAFVRPAVKRGQARIRLAITASHSEADITATLRAFAEVKAVLQERGLPNINEDPEP